MQISSVATQPHASDAVLRAMFSARKRVFVDLLKWDVPVLADAYELDQFDTPEATYLVLADQESGHRASTRLLRTDGPHILGDLFPMLCREPIPERPDYREITRFCIEPTLPRGERRRARNELISALVDNALETGISAYTAVATPGWYRQIVTFGWECRALGDERFVGHETLVALQIEIGPDTPAALARNGIYTRGSYQIGGTRRELVS